MFGFDSLSEVAFSDIPQTVVTVAATGVTGTGSVGTVAMGSRTVALTAVTGTGSVGTVVASDAEQEDSVTGTGSVGTVGISHAQGITGNTASGIVGTVIVAERTAAITAVTATGSVGTLGVLKQFALTGVTATGTAGSVKTWADIDTAETANWVNAQATSIFEDCGAFSGGAISATTLAGNIITLSDPNISSNWVDVDTTETTTWYPIAA